MPTKSGQRQAVLSAAVERAGTSIFYESPHRLLKSLEVLTAIAPMRLICVARELTKKFEEYRRAFPEELVAHYTAHPLKGEICLLVEGSAAAIEREKLAARRVQ